MSTATLALLLMHAVIHVVQEHPVATVKVSIVILAKVMEHAVNRVVKKQTVVNLLTHNNVAIAILPANAAQRNHNHQETLSSQLSQT